MYIGSGREVHDSYLGQPIIAIGQSDGDKVTLLSAKTGDKVTDTSVQLLRDIKHDGIVIDAKMNANYFVMSSGMALGVRCGMDEWSVPRQGAWYYYCQKINGTTEIGMDYDYWYTPDQVQFACSPAMILMFHRQIVNYKSPSAGNSKDNANTQSMLIRTSDRFIFAVCKGKLTPAQCREWAINYIEGVEDLILMDSGGSSCLEIHGNMAVNTSRKISNCLAFYHAPVIIDDEEKNVLNGIDISNWQTTLDLSDIKFDFVIVKATEGIGFVDKSCDKFYQQAKSLGKLLGFYHFARPTNDAVAEAKFFYENTKNYFGEAIPVLDWEAEHKEDVGWALRWLNEVQRLSGVKPMIYMSESVVNAYDWSPVVAGDYGLWVAKYRDNVPDYNYDMSGAGNAPTVKWWSGYAIWQWTSCGHLTGYSGSLDCDVFYGSKDAWKAYAKSSPIQDENTSGNDEISDLKAKIDALEAEIDQYVLVIKELKERAEKAQKALRGEL